MFDWSNVLQLFENTHELVDWIAAIESYLEPKNENQIDFTCFDIFLAPPTDDAIIHARDEHGNTPLHIACQFFHTGATDSMFACLEDEHQSAPYCLVAFMLLERKWLVS